MVRGSYLQRRRHSPRRTSTNETLTSAPSTPNLSGQGRLFTEEGNIFTYLWRSRNIRQATICLAFANLLFLTTLLPSALVGFDVEIAIAESGLDAGSQARVANTDGDGLRLRTEATAKSDTLLTLKENWLVTIKGGPFNDKAGNSFYQIEWSNRSGFAMSQYLVYAGKNSAALPGNNSKNLSIGGQARVSGTGGDGVRMRQQPNVSAASLAILNETYLVSVMGGPFNDKAGNSFFKVEWAGYTGYVSNNYLTSAPKNAVAGKGGTLRVTNTDGDPIRFRNGPGRDNNSNGYVYEGQVLKLLAGPFKDSLDNNWYKLERNGEVGYVDASYVRRTDQTVTTVTINPPRNSSGIAPPVAAAPKPLQPVPAPASNGPLGERIASYAKQFVGWRYIWGGNSPAAGGFDCSGLIYWVLTQNGVREVGRSVEAELTLGVPVALDQIQPGDILIWANTYKPGPSHSGIYLGGGRFIHAETESTGVSINNLNEPYYASRFYAARRPGV